MGALLSGRVSSRPQTEILIAVIVSPDSRPQEIKRSPAQAAKTLEQSKTRVAKIILRDSGTIRVSRKAGIVLGGVMERLGTTELAQARSVTATISRQTGEIMSSSTMRPIGTAIGTGIRTIGGVAIGAVSLTANGSYSMSGSIPTIIGIPTHTRMTNTHTIIIRTGTTRALTKAMRTTTIIAPTILRIKTPTRPLPLPRSS